MRKGEFLAIAVVIRPHGIRGAIQARYEGDDPQHFLALHKIGIGPTPEDLRPYNVLHVKPYKRLFIVELEGFTLEMAKRAAGQFLWAHRNQLPPLEEGVFYWVDLIGLRVVIEGGESLGTVRGLLSTGSNEVLACEAGDREVLIPFIEDIIVDVDLGKGRIVVRPPEGLL